MAAAFFWIFALALIASATLVISARNPVYSVLFLISAFVSAAGLFVLMGAEYLAMLLIVVYVGAVAVLFLFVVMMLDVDFVEMRQGFLNTGPLAGAVAVAIAVELVLVVGAWATPATRGKAATSPDATPSGNIESLGLVLYTDYVHYFQIAGIVLLVAMIGAIVLTFRQRAGVRRQDPAAQTARRREASVEIKKVRSGEGI